MSSQIAATDALADAPAEAVSHRSSFYLAMRILPRLQREAMFEVYVGSSRVDLQACKLEYSIVSPK